LRKPFKACGRLRDLQVVKRSLRRLRMPGQVPDQLWEQTRERVKRQKLRLVHSLGALHPRKTHGKVRNLAIKIKGVQRDSPRGQSSAHTRQAVMKVLERSRREMRDACRGARIVDSNSLHAARIAVKVCRYQLEVAPLLHMPGWRAELPGLRLLQKDLGRISDLTLLIGELERFVAKYPKAPRRLANARRSLGRERSRCFASVCAIRDKVYTGT
jgi:CHAD domain-containing protein